MSYLENAMKLRTAMDTAGAMLTDKQALSVKEIYSAWAVGVDYAVGDRRLYADALYKCIQEHTSQADWTPDLVPALWTVINEEHEGTIDDPIPYGGNMELFEGKYYVQDKVIYLCIRSTGVAVHHPLSELVGIYVEVANG